MKQIFFGFILGILAIQVQSQPHEFTGFPDFQGFTKYVSESVYYPENLWDYINGAADAYLGYGFRDLHIADYTKGKKISIRVEIYHHSDRDNAFGIYANERFPDYKFIPAGVQGYQQGNILNLFTGYYYVKMYGSSESQQVIDYMTDLAELVAGILGGNTGFPDAFSRLPVTGKLDNQDSYVAVNFMGYSFYPPVYLSEYSRGESNVRVFYFKCQDSKECQAILEKQAELSGMKGIPQGIVEIKDPYNGSIWFYRNDNEVWGITGAESISIAEEYFTEIENLILDE